MANRIHSGVMNYLLFKTQKRELSFDINVCIFVKLTRSFAQLPSATVMFISAGIFYLRAVRKELNVMVIDITIWI